MTTYYANTDLAAYNTQQTNYTAALDAWNTQTQALNEQYAAAQAEYDQLHAAWVNDPTLGTGEDQPEPQPPEPPTLPVQPDAPAPPSTTYDAQLASTVVVLDTALGDVLVTPGRYVLTPSSGGDPFALSETDLGATYTPTTSAQL
jgi:hypothetical protein